MLQEQSKENECEEDNARKVCDGLKEEKREEERQLREELEQKA